MNQTNAPKTIAIVEDNLDLSRVYERAFSFAGYAVSPIYDGAVALRTLTESLDAPTAIILDIRMPGMNGYDLLRALRADRRFDETPIAILTNSFSNEERDTFLSAGAQIYLIKIDQQIKDVVARIEELVEAVKHPH